MSLQLIALLVNVVLAIVKFAVGTLAGSRALLADAFNSAGDILATFVAWIAFRIGQHPPDEDHHYGHANAESLAGLVVGGMLCATGGFICIDGVLAWSRRSEGPPPETLALWTAVVTALVKELLFRASMRVGTRTHSPTLLASARDHRADVVTSLVAAAGILLARFGYSAFDHVAGVLIGVYIFWLGVAPIRTNLRVLMAGAPPELASLAAWHAGRAEGVRWVGRVQVLPQGGRYQLDLVIGVDGDLSVGAGHDIAHRAADVVRQAIPAVTDVRVHVEPTTVATPAGHDDR